MPGVTDNEEYSGDSDGLVEPTFIERIKRRILDDYENSRSFLHDFHEWCVDMHGYYHNAQKYVDLRKKNKFPSTAIQKDADLFVSDARDKLFYANRPCTIIGREDTDKEDAEVKQEFMDYQDAEDKIYSKTGLFLRDAALYRFCAAQVDYESRTRREWIEKDIPMVFRDEGGEPIIDESGAMVPIVDPSTGMQIPSGEKEWALEDIPDYRGATVKRIDPMNLFFTQDKSDVADEFGIIVRSRETRKFFDSKPYFFNQEDIQIAKGERATPTIESDAIRKREHTAQRIDASATSRPYDYLEWQGLVDKAELYEFELSRKPLPADAAKMKMATVKPGEQCVAIAGLVNGETVVQLREEPFQLNRPNIIVGYMSSEEEGLIGLSLAQKIEHVQKAEEDMFDMLIENLKQSVNAFWVINKTMLVGKKAIINRPGTVLETNANPRDVAMRIEQPRVAPDIYQVLSLLNEERQSAGGMQPIIEGRGDPEAETLGESNQALAQATLRLRDYLKTFEDSFVRPLYELRNHINATFIDTDYVFRVVGERGGAWRTIEPGQVRASVDFICESASRETNRAVIIQQILQLAQVAPLAQQAGQPTRFDKLLAELAESGFNWKRDKIEEIWPLLRLEREQGVDVDQLLIQSAIMQMGFGAGALPGQPGAPGPGQEIPHPTNNSEAVTANQARNQPPVRSIQN